MMWRVVAKHASSLSKEFRDAYEELKKVLTGAKKSEDLWKRCMGEADRAIGMALGALFIEEAFEGSSKELVNKHGFCKRSLAICCAVFIWLLLWPNCCMATASVMSLI